MRPDAQAVTYRRLDRHRHRQRVTGVSAAGEVDARHRAEHLQVITDFPGAVRLAGIDVQVNRMAARHSALSHNVTFSWLPVAAPASRTVPCGNRPLRPVPGTAAAASNRSAGR